MISRTTEERSDITFEALAGLPLGARPGFWQRYDQGKSQVLARARPLEELKKRFPDGVSEIDTALKSASSGSGKAGSVGYIPMVGRKTFWTVLVDTNTAEVIAFCTH